MPTRARYLGAIIHMTKPETMMRISCRFGRDFLVKPGDYVNLIAYRSIASTVFDRELKRRHRAKSLLISDGDYYDYLRKEAAHRLIDRLRDITRTFPVALELGSHRQHVLNEILSSASEDDTEVRVHVLSIVRIQ
jgi:hypothetical protein